jgi:hypothetical protein
MIYFFIATAGVNSLLMPMSSKGTVTYYSRSDGEEAIFYNPSYFEATGDYRLSCFYNNLYVGMKSISLALSRKIKTVDFGISIMNYDYGEIEARPAYPTEDSVMYYSAYDFVLGVCGALRVSEQGRFGLNLKYVYESVYIYSGNTIAFDAAIAYRSDNGGISFGATNVGASLTLHNEEVSLPSKLSLGFHRKVMKAMASLDLHYLTNTGAFELGCGFEVPLSKSLEIGFAANYREQVYPGANLTLNLGGFAVKYGTAIYPYDLGMVNTLGIGFSF